MRDPCKVKIIYDDADGRRREKPFELNLLESVPVEVAKICELFSIDNSNNYTLVLKGAFQDEDGDVVASEEVHESMFYLSDDQFNRQVELNEGDELFLMLKPSYVASRCITNLKEKSEGIDTSIRELRRMLMVEVDVAEEFIAQGGIPALVQFSAHASGPLQSYGLLAMKSCLTYVSAIDALADSQQVVEDLYSILCNTNSNSNSNGNNNPNGSTPATPRCGYPAAAAAAAATTTTTTADDKTFSPRSVAAATTATATATTMTTSSVYKFDKRFYGNYKSTLEILIVLLHYLEKGFTFIMNAARKHSKANAKRTETREKPFRNFYGLLSSDSDVDLQVTTLILMNLLLNKAPDEHTVKKILFWWRIGGLAQAVEDISASDRIEQYSGLKEQVELFKAANRAIIPQSWFEANELKEQLFLAKKENEKMKRALEDLRKQRFESDRANTSSTTVASAVPLRIMSAPPGAPPPIPLSTHRRVAAVAPTPTSEAPASPPPVPKIDVGINTVISLCIDAKVEGPSETESAAATSAAATKTPERETDVVLVQKAYFAELKAAAEKVKELQQKVEQQQQQLQSSTQKQVSQLLQRASSVAYAAPASATTTPSVAAAAPTGGTRSLINRFQQQAQPSSVPMPQPRGSISPSAAARPVVQQDNKPQSTQPKQPVQQVSPLPLHSLNAPQQTQAQAQAQAQTQAQTQTQQQPSPRTPTSPPSQQQSQTPPAQRALARQSGARNKAAAMAAILELESNITRRASLVGKNGDSPAVAEAATLSPQEWDHIFQCKLYDEKEAKDPVIIIAPKQDPIPTAGAPLSARSTSPCGGSAPRPTSLPAAHQLQHQQHLPGKKLKTLHWEKISCAPRHSIWTEITAPETSELDLEAFECMFEQKDSGKDNSDLLGSTLAMALGGSLSSHNSVSITSGLEVSSNGNVVLVDQRLYNAIAIMLHKLPPIPILRSALATMDDKVISKESLSLIIKNLPHEEDFKDFIKARPQKKTDLDKVEQYVEMLTSIPHCALRLRCWSFIHEFPQYVHEISAPTTALSCAIKEVRESQNLKTVFGYIITLGNYMNRGTNKGKAEGFSIESLDKLEETRDRTNTTSLFQYLCKTIFTKYQKQQQQEQQANKDQAAATAEDGSSISSSSNTSIINLPDELQNVKSAAKISMSTTEQMLDQLRVNMKKLKSELSIISKKAASDDVSIKKLQEFNEQAKESFAKVEEEYHKAAQDFMELLNYFGVPPKRHKDTTPEMFFGSLSKFLDLYRLHMDQLARQTKLGGSGLGRMMKHQGLLVPGSPARGLNAAGGHQHKLGQTYGRRISVVPSAFSDGSIDWSKIPDYGDTDASYPRTNNNNTPNKFGQHVGHSSVHQSLVAKRTGGFSVGIAQGGGTQGCDSADDLGDIMNSVKANLAMRSRHSIRLHHSPVFLNK